MQKSYLASTVARGRLCSHLLERNWFFPRVDVESGSYLRRIVKVVTEFFVFQMKRSFIFWVMMGI